MKRRAVVQADALAEFSQTDAVAVARDLFHDAESAAERLHAATLTLGRIGVGTHRGDAGSRAGGLLGAGTRRRHGQTGVTSSVTGDVTTMKTRSTSPVFVIACTQPGGRKM